MGNKIFESWYAPGGQGSGPGSEASYTEPWRKFLEAFLKEHKIRSVLDYGCGDWQFSELIDWGDIDYLGVDVVDSLIEGLQGRYGGPRRRFLKVDPDDRFWMPPPVDLVVSKDVLQHLSTYQISLSLARFGVAKHWLLVNDLPAKGEEHRDIASGGFRGIDLTKPPFELNATTVFEFAPQPHAIDKKIAILHTPKRAAARKDWDVVIPGGSASNVEECRTALFLAHPDMEHERLVVVDGGCGREGADRHPGVRWEDAGTPFSFPRAVNRGVRKTSAPYVVIMGDDVVVRSPGAFDEMAAFLEANPEFWMASAGIEGNTWVPTQTWDPRSSWKEEIFGPPLRGGKAGYHSFVCQMVRRDVWEKLGGLDERYVGYGYDDADFCWRLAHAGGRAATVMAARVRHHALPSCYVQSGRKTALAEVNRKAFVEKWTLLLGHAP